MVSYLKLISLSNAISVHPKGCSNLAINFNCYPLPLESKRRPPAEFPISLYLKLISVSNTISVQNSSASYPKVTVIYKQQTDPDGVSDRK